MFWGLVLKANKRYSQRVTKAFHVSQATLDTNTVGDEKSIVQVWVTIDDVDHLIANVSGRSSHVTMDVIFTEGESVAFYSKGTGTVHLSGYLLPEDDLPGIGDYDEDAESEEEAIELKEMVSSKKQEKLNNKKAVKAVQNESDDEEDEDDDDSDDLDLLNELENEDGEDEEDSDEDDDEDEDMEEDDDDEDEEEEEEEEEELKQPPNKMAKFEKGANQNGLTNGKLPKKDKEHKQQPQQDQQKHQKNKKQDQKQDQKQKNQQQQQQQNQQQQKGGNTKHLPGGVVIEDLRVGKGPEAKIGRKISVYYEGRLKTNNKVFDSTKSGDGFQFLLGRGEVIRGWDVGIAGMKVGSKRRITCPPNVAYGNKGSPPVIPGNATLVFDVELRGVN